MNKLCKQYISEVKAFFPIMGKNEKDYIAKLRINVDNFCDEVDISTKKELYKQYGLPNDVANDYYSTVETEEIIKRIHISKYVKCSMIILLVLAVLATSVYCVTLQRSYQTAHKEEMLFISETIE